MKFKTVREGQQAIIFNHLGEGELVVGPKRVFLFRKRFKLLRHYSVTSDEYLVVHEKDGTVYNKPGPCELFHNPLLYDEVHAKQAIKLDAKVVVVIYKRLQNGNVQRRIVEGPAVVIPEAEEWLHEFVWHGTDPNNKARMVPGQRRFRELPTIPENFYYNVREVRTNDDTMITVKVMVFYVVVDILQMLDTTHDPIADIINALCADVIAFVSKLSYNQFIEQTAQLSKMETYPQLQQRTKRIGFSVDKVVYRGYHASDQMQEMQNSAIESRTRLRLEGEMEKMRQNLASLKLNSEEARAGLKKKMEADKLQHKHTIEQMKQEHELNQQQMQHTQRMELRSLETSARLQRKKDEDEQQLDYLKKLSELDVDITEYLISQEEPTPTKQIRVTSI